MFQCQSCRHAFLRAILAVHTRRSKEFHTATLKRLEQASEPPSKHRGSPKGSLKDAFSRGDSTSYKKRRETGPSTIREQDNEQSFLPRTQAKQDDVDPQTEKLEREARFELRRLKDPMKLADHVQDLLKANREQKAVALVKMSSRAKLNIVSWNHLIAYQFMRKWPNKALQTWNDMKKRGLTPTHHTYTIVLNGLAVNAGNPKALDKALSIYSALCAPTSKIEPNIYQSNAMLKVCSRSGDLDSMWEILSKLPSKGPHAPNARTYTIVLNTLRYKCIEKPDQRPADEEADQDPSEEQTDYRPSHGAPESARLMEDAISDGLNLWPEILKLWHQGDLAMEEELVVAMGRLLLASNRHSDALAVFDLMEQTMSIPRSELIKGTAGLKVDGQAADNPFTTPPPSAIFNKTKPAKPGNLALSVLVGACAQCNLKSVGDYYWTLLTTERGVVPDDENILVRLQSLAKARASETALELLAQALARWKIASRLKYFRIAMSACTRNEASPKAWSTAGSVLELMYRQSREIDLPAMDKYVAMTLRKANQQLAAFEQEQGRPSTWREMLDSPDPSAQKYHQEVSNILEGGLLRLEEGTARLDSQLRFGTKSMDRDTTAGIFRDVMRMYSRAISYGKLTHEMAKRFENKRTAIQEAIVQFGFEKKDERRKNGPTKNEHQGKAADGGPAPDRRRRNAGDDKVVDA